MSAGLSRLPRRPRRVEQIEHLFGYCGEVRSVNLSVAFSSVTANRPIPVRRHTDYRRGTMTQAPDREKALELAMAQIERATGKAR